VQHAEYVRQPWKTAVSIVVGAYFLRFAPESGGWPSQAPENWAQFGEYVGGVFGLPAFAGVLYTVELQRRQLELQRQQIRQLTDQATVDELHRLCREIASNIDRELDVSIIVHQATTPELNRLNLVPPMRSVLELAVIYASRAGS
jgi:hypothetical protein